MRDLGFTVEVVERSTNFGGRFRRHDLFGIADLLALGDGEVWLIQVTSASNVSARVKKITDSDHIAAIRKAGIGVMVHGWAKRANGRYELREVDLS